MNKLFYLFQLIIITSSAGHASGDELDDFCHGFVAACNAYQAENKSLPTSEADIVPKFLSEEKSVVLYQGMRLKFVFLPREKYRLNPEERDRYVLAALSRPVRYSRKGDPAVFEGRNLVLSSLYGWWVSEWKFEAIVSCREEPIPPPPAPKEPDHENTREDIRNQALQNFNRAIDEQPPKSTGPVPPARTGNPKRVFPK